MKHLEGRLTLLINREYTTIEIEDELSGTRFVRLKISPEEFQAALSRQAMVKCDMEVGGFDNVGKKQEVDKFEFVLPEYWQNEYGIDEEALANYAQSLLDKEGDGWVIDRYFRSQNSYYKNQVGKRCARGTIRRWLSVDNKF